MYSLNYFLGRVGCGMSAYGILGTVVTEHLLARRFDVTGFGENQKALAEMMEHYAIDVATHINDIGKVDAVIACTHNVNTRLNSEHVERLRKRNRKLLVIDVAEPANLDEQTYTSRGHACGFSK